MKKPLSTTYTLRLMLLTSAVLFGNATGATTPLPEKDGLVHQGVATCATSVCHGKSSPVDKGNVRLNEYHTWLKEDLHSRAYKVLLNAQSRQIARELGLPSAQSAKICLDCHSDNVPTETRGAKFQITDGIGCEGCHGGSEKWLESHTEPGISHRDNLKRGMYPTEEPVARAQLCLSCHLGTREKFAGHDIMGAGHPRLVFELESFTANQPAHYDRDKDYAQRKGEIPAVRQWAVGLAVTSASLTELMRSKLLNTGGLFPELAFFECHACHHSMAQTKWQPLPLEKGVKAGDVRFNDSSLDLLFTVIAVTGGEQSSALKAAVRELHWSISNNRRALPDSLAALSSVLQKISANMTNWQYSNSDLDKLRKGIVGNIGNGNYRDYTSAEQAFLAVETISLELGDTEKYNAQLDKLYALLADENSFSPAKFAAAANNFGL